MNGPSCETCRFYFEAGECRKNTPKNYRHRWPRVEPHDWCGQFQNKATIQASEREMSQVRGGTAAAPGL
jgi:hypothetical protein